MNERYIVVNSLDGLTNNYLGEGLTGICYKVDNKVFKKFKMIPRFPGLVKQLSMIHSDSFVFPNEFVYLNEYDIKYLQGYLMSYIDGVSLKNINEIVNMKELCITLDNLEKEIKSLTEKDGLLIKDLHTENMLFTKDNKFKIIDTDLCVINPYDTVYNYRENMKELGNCILPVLMGNSDITNSKVKYMYDLCTLESKAKPSKVLYEAIDCLEKETNEEIVTLHDFKENMKLIRK